MTGAVLFQHPRNFAQAGKDNVNASLVETARAEMVLKTRELRRERAHRAVKIASVECLLESQCRIARVGGVWYVRVKVEVFCT